MIGVPSNGMWGNRTTPLTFIKMSKTGGALTSCLGTMATRAQRGVRGRRDLGSIHKATCFGYRCNVTNHPVAQWLEITDLRVLTVWSVGELGVSLLSYGISVVISSWELSWAEMSTSPPSQACAGAPQPSCMWPLFPHGPDTPVCSGCRARPLDSKKTERWTSLAVQWLRLHLPIQGCRFDPW